MDQLYELERTEARRRARNSNNDGPFAPVLPHRPFNKSNRTSPINTPHLADSQLAHAASVPSMNEQMSLPFASPVAYPVAPHKPSVSGLCHSGLASTAAVALGGPLPTPPICGHQECLIAYTKAVRLAQRGSNSGFNRSTSSEFLNPSMNPPPMGYMRSHPSLVPESWADIQGNGHSFRIPTSIHSMDNVPPNQYRESLQRQYSFHDSSNISSPGSPSSVNMEVIDNIDVDRDHKHIGPPNIFTPSGSPFLGPLRSLALSHVPSAASSRAPSPVLLPPPLSQVRNSSISQLRETFGQGFTRHHQSKSESHLRMNLQETVPHFNYNHVSLRNALNTPNLSSGPSSASSPSSPRPSDPASLFPGPAKLPGISRESSPSISRPPSPLTIAPRSRKERQASHNHRLEFAMSPINPIYSRSGIAGSLYHSQSIPPSRSGSPPIVLPPLQTSDEQILHGKKRKLDIQLPGFSELRGV